MTPQEAAKFVMPWGKFEGRTLDSIASTSKGLLYLDWLRGQTIRDPRVQDAVYAYVDQPCILREIEQLVDPEDV